VRRKIVYVRGAAATIMYYMKSKLASRYNAAAAAVRPERVTRAGGARVRRSCGGCSIDFFDFTNARTAVTITTVIIRRARNNMHKRLALSVCGLLWDCCDRRVCCVAAITLKYYPTISRKKKTTITSCPTERRERINDKSIRSIDRLTINDNYW